MSDKVKQETFELIWEKFEEMRDALLTAGVAENRLQSKDVLQKKLKDWPLEKVQAGYLWICNFDNTAYTNWCLIRRENPEAYWKNAKDQGWGKNFPEVREMNFRNNELRTMWFDRHNILVRERRNRGKPKDKQATV